MVRVIEDLPKAGMQLWRTVMLSDELDLHDSNHSIVDREVPSVGSRLGTYDMLKY